MKKLDKNSTKYFYSMAADYDESLCLRIEECQRTGEELWLPVVLVAEHLGIPVRRFLVWCVEHQIKARKLKNGIWEVTYPLGISTLHPELHKFFLNRRNTKLKRTGATT